MPSFFKIQKNFFILIILSHSFFIFPTNSLLPFKSNIKENIINKNPSCEKDSFYKEENFNFFRKLSYSCATTSYSKSDIKSECDYGPSSYDRLLQYRTFSNYISSHSYHSNGLNYVTSFFVDQDTHHYGNFMNDGVGMIILYIIFGLMIIGWIPILCCWRKRCCLFDDCIYESDCCIIFWHILTYVLAAAILSFLIVILCFGE